MFHPPQRDSTNFTPVCGETVIYGDTCQCLYPTGNRSRVPCAATVHFTLTTTQGHSLHQISGQIDFIKGYKTDKIQVLLSLL